VNLEQLYFIHKEQSLKYKRLRPDPPDTRISNNFLGPPYDNVGRDSSMDEIAKESLTYGYAQVSRPNMFNLDRFIGRTCKLCAEYKERKDDMRMIDRMYLATLNKHIRIRIERGNYTCEDCKEVFRWNHFQSLTIPVTYFLVVKEQVKKSFKNNPSKLIRTGYEWFIYKCESPGTFKNAKVVATGALCNNMYEAVNKGLHASEDYIK